MTKVENRMKELAGTARAALEELHAPAAAEALDRFMAVNDEIVTLSRRNSNVRSLALSLGRKRMVTAECEDDLRALEKPSRSTNSPLPDNVTMIHRSRSDSRPTAR